MKKINLIFVLGYLIFPLLFEAQDSRVSASDQSQNWQENPFVHSRNEATRAQEKLALDKDQFLQWYRAALERRHANESLYQEMKNSSTPAEKSSIAQKIKENRMKFESTVNQFLNEEQKTKWESWKKEIKNYYLAKQQSKNAPLTLMEELELVELE